MKSKLYIAAGFGAVALGIAGIPLPLLPTTPFLLLAAYCFARGSERWHQWLLTHPKLSPYILAFREKRGLTRKQKWRIAGALTLTLLVSGAFSPYLIGKVLALAFWLGWMIFLFTRPSPLPPP
ncbi:MAG: YbaN family protein [Blastocatellia bacterium]